MDPSELCGFATGRELRAKPTPRDGAVRQLANAIRPPSAVLLVEVLHERQRADVRVGGRTQAAAIETIDNAAVVVEEQSGKGDGGQLRCVSAQRRDGTRDGRIDERRHA